MTNMQRSVLITGCTTGGAGHALAKEYQSRGLLVFATARRLESMKDLELLPGVVMIRLDVLDESSIANAVRQVESHLDQEDNSSSNDPANSTASKKRGLDILINNAGTTSILPFADAPPSVSRAIIETNVIAPMMVTKAFLPLLLRSGDARIICTGSGAALAPSVGHAYNASKAALRSWCDTLRMELAPFNIKVIHFVMGMINTNISTQILDPLPPDSLYAPIEHAFLDRRRKVGGAGISVAQFARQAVDVSLRPNPPKEAFIGGGASSILWANRILPRAMINSSIAAFAGLKALASLRKKGASPSAKMGKTWLDTVLGWMYG